MQHGNKKHRPDKSKPNRLKPAGKRYRDKRGSGAGASEKRDSTNQRSPSPSAEANPDSSIRLNKYISNSGVCSRRDADRLIANGEIKVNGKVVTELGTRVNYTDKVYYKGKPLNPEKKVYILLNKPKGYITTMDDPDNRKTVMDLVQDAAKQRIYPVGRLDRNTTGLLLLTNDGELAEKLAHPSGMVRKLYQVHLDKAITDEDFLAIERGIELEDGTATVDEMGLVDVVERKTLGLQIHIGKNRIVRRIFEHLGYDVVKLDRVMYAGLTKKDVGRGKWRHLNEKEIIRLRHFDSARL